MHKVNLMFNNSAI